MLYLLKNIKSRRTFARTHVEEIDVKRERKCAEDFNVIIWGNVSVFHTFFSFSVTNGVFTVFNYYVHKTCQSPLLNHCMFS